MQKGIMKIDKRITVNKKCVSNLKKSFMENEM